jgi:mannan endo-1,4-beta-mannosidase
MKQQGDMWAWFMTWNGDFTRSDRHNGAEWWKKLMGNELVVSRD